MALALKEWPAAIHALNTGEIILLFRKGGIREKSFEHVYPKHQAFLFPSFEHQQSSALKSTSTDVSQAYNSGTPIHLQNWVEFYDCIEVTNDKIIPALGSYHIWTDDYLHQRYQWKPERPLFCIFCRTYRLNCPVTIPYDHQYGGCRSWIELKREISFYPCASVLSDSDFEQQAKAIQKILNQFKQ